MNAENAAPPTATNPSAEASSAEPRAFAAPLVDVFEDEASFVLLADLPGVRAEGISLDLEKQDLTLAARREDQPTDFRRRFSLPVAVDAEGVKARLDHGVLRVEVPKAAEARPRSIPVLSA